MTWRRGNSIYLNFGKWNEIVKSPAKDLSGGEESQAKSSLMLVSLISFGIMVIKSKVSHANDWNPEDWGEISTMKQFKKSIVAAIMMAAMLFFVAGCGNSKQAADSSDSTTSSKVVKKSVKADKKANKESTKDSKADKESSESAATSNSANSQATSNSESSSSSSSAVDSSRQLGLADVATWTDENGVTHHVDSDGMDRQTKNGQTTYADWSGPLPSNATIIRGSSSTSSN